MSKQLLFGNQAFCEGAIAAGARFYAGYPITPATEVAEFMSQRMPEVGGTYVQMEDELGSMNAVIGASATGVKSVTASAGPGMALIQNELGQAIVAEIPAVVINVQRAGPGIGNATRSGQMEIMQSRYGPNGECPAVALSPSTVEEAFWLTVKAVNLSEQLRTVVLVLGEGLLGLQRAVVDLPDDYDEVEKVERPRPTLPPADYRGAYAANLRTDIPPIADFGSGYKTIVNTVGIQPIGGGDGSILGMKEGAQDFTIRRLHEKILARKDEITMTEELMLDDAEVVYIAFGTQARSAMAAAAKARARGIKAGVLRLITIWPFPEDAVRAACAKARAVVVPEMNLGQARMLVVNALAGADIPVVGINHVDSSFITPDQIVAKTEEVLQ
ncbi:MAG: transketolase C-terminal domain-containing protein [Alphaproteobacteria bacterium]|jgi:2-oxoglutarate ferredoxin oxidoreductase subunit alpha|nr:transketolase C-terminal domain-containing protein [Alphaproteobacteria bacterium]MDP6567934.1 transketolase C-terminal domain-containing protein [Alphaproteobacteria bacterium]MDP6812344.1 transketolase C-terminal domain-containing protein [Alphaproteobacteria bacterium]